MFKRNSNSAGCTLVCSPFGCEFKKSVQNNIQLIHMLVLWLLKTKWMLAGQNEESDFINTWYNMHYNPSDTEELTKISMALTQLEGKLELKLQERKNSYFITSKFSSNLKNIEIIRLGLNLMLDINGILSDNEQDILENIMDELKNYFLNYSKDASFSRLENLYNKANECIKPYY